MAEPHRVITLEIDGQLVRITVEHERSEYPAAYGFSAERNVYKIDWDDCQIDGSRTGLTAAARRGRWPRPPRRSAMSGSR